MVMHIFTFHSIVKNTYFQVIQDGLQRRYKIITPKMCTHISQPVDAPCSPLLLACPCTHTRAHAFRARFCSIMRPCQIPTSNTKKHNSTYKINMGRWRNGHKAQGGKKMTIDYSMNNVRHCDTVNEGNAPNEVHFLPKNKKLPSQK